MPGPLSSSFVSGILAPFRLYPCVRARFIVPLSANLFQARCPTESTIFCDGYLRVNSREVIAEVR